MSYADVEGQLRRGGFQEDILEETASGVDQTVECVQRSILTEMDGRDLARCLAMEKKHGVEAYTVSQELGAVYDTSKHLHANFNRASFCKSLKRAFGEDILFQQIILDYFWIPKGTWVMTHWTKSFFKEILPSLVDFLEKPRMQYSSTALERGAIFLPFCYHCVKEIVAALPALDQCYAISFIRKDQLSCHALWSGTSSIDATLMQETLGKQRNQEDFYCTFSARDVWEAMDDSTVTKEEVVRYLECIEDFADIRMIRLKPLPAKERGKQHMGGFVGLMDPSTVMRGFFGMIRQARRVSDCSESDSADEEAVESEDIRVSLSNTESEMQARTRKARKLYTVVKDLNSYQLLDVDANVSRYYEIKKPDRKTLFPDFRRSYLEIIRNEHMTKTHDEKTIELLDFCITSTESLIARESGTGSNSELGVGTLQPVEVPNHSSSQLQDAAAKLLLLRRQRQLYSIVHPKVADREEREGKHRKSSLATKMIDSNQYC
jgi:hypothetical protein